MNHVDSERGFIESGEGRTDRDPESEGAGEKRGEPRRREELRRRAAERKPTVKVEERAEHQGDVGKDGWGPFGEDGLGEWRHGELGVAARWSGLGGDSAGGVAGRRLLGWVKSFEESDEGGGLRRTEVFAVGGHVAATLDDLANQLILCEKKSDFVEGGATLAAVVAESVAIVALLELEDERALAFEGRAIFEELLRNGIAAPGVHDRAPGSVACHVGERT